MPVNVKLDEDLSPAVAAPLQAAGHTVRTVVEQGWGGQNDATLFAGVCTRNEFFITGDKGFGDFRAFPPGTHPGILLLRPGQDTVSQQLALIRSVLEQTGLEPLIGAVSVATPTGLRIRRSAG